MIELGIEKYVSLSDIKVMMMVVVLFLHLSSVMAEDAAPDRPVQGYQ